ncbi:hypothetical protein WOLCODRAFT_29699, partial [Wolfiporia cocos MD-104 SS10]
MSEYWVSHKRYFCKYCNIYIADDVPSRRQHEGGLRHKGNVERFVRGLYKEGERRKHDREEERREMARVEQAANAAFARDIGAGLVRPGSSSAVAASSPSSSSTVRPSARPAPRPSDPYANYSTAASLGFTDPDAERAQAEAERRRTQGVVGTWEVVGSPTPPPLATPEEEEQGEDVKPEVGQKRPAETVQDDDGEDARRFRLKRRTVGAGLREIYDPGVIPIKVKKWEEKAEKAEGASSAGLGVSVPAGEARAEGGASAGASQRPKWSAMGWRRPGESGGSGAQTGKEVAEGGQGDV